MTRREHLLKQVKEHAEKMRKFQQEFHKNMSNKDEMTSKDLQYMNKVFEQMKLDHDLPSGKLLLTNLHVS